MIVNVQLIVFFSGGGRLILRLCDKAFISKRKSFRKRGNLMKVSRLFAVALSGLLFVQAPVVAFAEEYSQEGQLYQCDSKGSDYLFVGDNGFFLSDTEHQNKDNPYPFDSNNTAFTQVTDKSADGKEYGAGHAFDCQQSPESGYVGGLKDPYITGHSEPLTDGQVLKLSYIGEETNNYRLSLTTASPGSESS